MIVAAKSKVNHGEWLDVVKDLIGKHIMDVGDEIQDMQKMGDLMIKLAAIEPKTAIERAISTIESRLVMLGIDDWNDIRKAEATLDAYKKYTAQDEGLRHEALQIGKATVRLKWHKGRILVEMEKAQGKRMDLVAECNQVGTPTYSDLGIDKNKRIA